MLQALRSKASEIANSYPISVEHHPKVIQRLKDRFGKEDTLIQLYVCDVLQLVMCNNSASRKKFQLSSLYDNVEMKYLSLESLGVTGDRYTILLRPFVEFSLLQVVLKIWKRELEKSVENKSELNSLLNFLKNKVISEERVLLIVLVLALTELVRNLLDLAMLNIILCQLLLIYL